MAAAEQFVCKLYEPSSTFPSIQNVFAAQKFRKPRANVDTLPTTKDALDLHIKQANYQTLVWKQYLCTDPILPSPVNRGWKMVDGLLQPHLLQAQPVAANCLPLTVCGCKEAGNRCSTRQCLCRKKEMFCTGACHCARTSWCMNSVDNVE